MSELISVKKADANAYCKILTLLSMEEEGDPVAAVESLQRELAAANEGIKKFEWLGKLFNHSWCGNRIAELEKELAAAKGLLGECLESLYGVPMSKRVRGDSRLTNAVERFLGEK